eukprot:6492706-Amphidinium_carterae.1
MDGYHDCGWKLSCRMNWFGNPKHYALWSDEHFNFEVRRVAESSHSHRFEERVLAAINRPS